MGLNTKVRMDAVVDTKHVDMLSLPSIWFAREGHETA
jgi:hypothetical protein